MARKLVTAPTLEPVNLAQVKAQLNISGAADDGLLAGLIMAARQQAETITRRALVTSTWDLVLDGFPDSDDDAIEIPLPPLQSITSITYTDTAEASQTLAASSYVVDSTEEPGRVYLAYGESWPDVLDQPQSVTIRFVAGYPITSKTASTISAASTDNSFSDSGNSFTFSAGQGITSSGLSNAANNGAFLITSATAGKLIVSGGTLTTESAGASVTIKTPTTPFAVQQWIMARVASLYEQRESLAAGNLTELNSRFLDGLLDRYVVPLVV